ncbi:hypothetical protein ACGFNU_08170 [Spirillospora sp. NPDC048911]|uniref:hypothetical protein n=1 Tax=Spirillospora sp. NPDC048911 TaxID=3364527 RepID=UPI0037178495
MAAVAAGPLTDAVLLTDAAPPVDVRRRVTRTRVGAAVTGVLVAAAVAGGIATVRVSDGGGRPQATGTRPMR